MIHETEQEQNLRLQTLQRNDAQRLINENEEQWNLRVQRLRLYSYGLTFMETEQQTWQMTTLLVEQKLKRMRNDKTDSNCFNKMLLCTERTRGYNIYKIKLIATVIFPTGGEMQNSLYKNSNEYCLVPATQNKATSILCPRLKPSQTFENSSRIETKLESVKCGLCMTVLIRI